MISHNHILKLETFEEHEIRAIFHAAEASLLKALAPPDCYAWESMTLAPCSIRAMTRSIEQAALAVMQGDFARAKEQVLK